MDVIVSISLIILALLIGLGIGIPTKRKLKRNIIDAENKLSELESEKQSLLSQISSEKTKKDKLLSEKQSLLSKISSIEHNNAANIDDIRKRYENLLKEAEKQSEELDKRLKNAINGNLDESIKNQLAEAEELKKQISELEEEIEDKEDDLSSMKKKIRVKDEELSNVQDLLQKEQCSNKNLQEELTSTKISLKDAKEELTLKIGSLSFIQEILSAIEVKDGPTQKQNRAIDRFETFVQDQFLNLYSYIFENTEFTYGERGGNEGFTFYKKYILDSLDKWTATKRKNWLDGKTTIALVGEFSAGKTSIVNRILSQDNPDIPKLPVSAKATTAIPTYIAGRNDESYHFISGDGKEKVILPTTFKMVSKEILNQVNGISSLIKYFVMTYNNPNLKGLSILDTPGFNSNDKEDADRTIGVINECDALFWVFDVNAGTVNRSSLSLIKEKLNKPLYVVINKCDTKAESEIQKVENLIRKTFVDAGMQVEQFIRFSQTTPLKQIMEPIKSITRDTTRETFVQDIENEIVNTMNGLEEQVKEDSKKYHSAKKKGNTITNKFISTLKDLCNDCETAKSIPHWEEHIFHSNKYEMSEDEGDELIDLLGTISEESIPQLRKKFDENTNQAHIIETTYNSLCESKATFQKVNDCYNEFKKISKNIN